MAEILNMILAGVRGGGFLLFAVCLYIGVIAACVVSLAERRVMGDYVRALISKGALSPERALTLAESGFSGKRAIVRALRGKGVFAGTVYEASEEVDFDREDHAMPIYRERFDEEKARFYIPECLKYRAEVRFEKKGTHVMTLVLAVILFGALLALTLIFRERVSQFLQDYITAMSF